jgi:hypothetical protein
MPALLIDSENAELLTKDEAEHLGTVLTLLRRCERESSKGQVFIDFCGRLGYYIRRDAGIPDFADLVRHAVQALEGSPLYDDMFVAGVLDGHKGEAEPLEKGEAEALHEYLTLLRTNGWLPVWIKAVVSVEAQRRSEGRPRITPLDLLRTLEEDLNEFDMSIADARETIALYPELFPPPAPPAEPSGLPPSQSTPAAPAPAPAPAQAGGKSSGRTRKAHAHRATVELSRLHLAARR